MESEEHIKIKNAMVGKFKEWHPGLISVLTYAVCILLTVSLSQVTAQTLFPGMRGMSMVSNFNFNSAPFTTNPLNDSSNCDFTSYPDFCIYHHLLQT